jgi:hypothetical protein
MLKHLSQQLLWSRLRWVGNSVAARLTILIPLVGYLIIFNERLLSYSNLSVRLFGQIEPVSWRLLIVYFGLVLIAIGSVLFAIFCPLELKIYASANQFIQAEEPSMSELRMQLIEQSLEEGDENARFIHEQLLANSSNRPTAQNVQEIRHRGKIIERTELDIYFQMLDRAHLAIRLCVGVSYTIGFCMLFIPSADVFFRVTVVLMQLLFP